MPNAEANDVILPKPGTMVRLSPAYNPPILRGIKVHPDNPFKFEFILDQGDVVIASEAKQSQQEQLKTESTRLIKYFLASITVPESDLWVNLSPYEKNRIIPDAFGKTEMGRDLLAQDYMLKQITASLIYPEDELGKKFWQRIYAEAQKRFGTTNIPVNTFNKVWIIPEKAVVYENTKAGTAYVVESKLKVMLEQDYLSLSKNVIARSPKGNVAISKAGIASPTARNDINKLHSANVAEISSIGANIVREIVIPELTKEVNEGKNFAQLRQVYNSLILATWYKKKIKDSILAQVYADKSKIAGVGYSHSVIARSPKGDVAISNIGIASPTARNDDIDAIYQQYLKAFKKGVYNYIKDPDPTNVGSGAASLPRKYFSGGFFLPVAQVMIVKDAAQLGIPASALPVRAVVIRSKINKMRIDEGDLTLLSFDNAMNSTKLPDGITDVTVWSKFLRDNPTIFGKEIDPYMKMFWQSVFDRFPENAKVLDLATGNFVLPRLAIDQGKRFQFWAVDIADIKKDSVPQGVRVIQSRLEDIGHQGSSLPYDLDFVVSEYGLEYSDWVKSLPQIANRMKPQAEAIFLMHHWDSGIKRRAKIVLDQYAIIDGVQLLEKVLRFFEDPPTVDNFQFDSRSRDVTDAFIRVGIINNSRWEMIQRGQLHNNANDVLGLVIASVQHAFRLYEKGQFTKTQLEELKKRIHYMQYAKWLNQERVRVSLEEKDMQRFMQVSTEVGLECLSIETLNRGSEISGWVVKLRKKLGSGASQASTAQASINRRVALSWLIVSALTAGIGDLRKVLGDPKRTEVKVDKSNWSYSPVANEFFNTFDKMNREKKENDYRRREDNLLARKFIDEIKDASKDFNEFKITLENYMEFGLIRSVLMPKEIREELYKNWIDHQERKKGVEIRDRRPLAVAITDTADWNGGLKERGAFAKSLMQKYRVLWTEAYDWENLIDRVIDTTQFTPADLLVLRAHGTEKVLGGDWIDLPGANHWGGILLTSTKITEFSKKLSGRVKEVGLDSCSSGGACVGMKIAEAIAEIFNAKTHAPEEPTTAIQFNPYDKNKPFIYKGETYEQENKLLDGIIVYPSAPTPAMLTSKASTAQVLSHPDAAMTTRSSLNNLSGAALYNHPRFKEFRRYFESGKLLRITPYGFMATHFIQAGILASKDVNYEGAYNSNFYKDSVNKSKREEFTLAVRFLLAAVKAREDLLVRAIAETGLNDEMIEEHLGERGKRLPTPGEIGVFLDYISTDPLVDEEIRNFAHKSELETGNIFPAHLVLSSRSAKERLQGIREWIEQGMEHFVEEIIGIVVKTQEATDSVGFQNQARELEDVLKKFGHNLEIGEDKGQRQLKIKLMLLALLSESDKRLDASQKQILIAMIIYLNNHLMNIKDIETRDLIGQFMADWFEDNSTLKNGQREELIGKIAKARWGVSLKTSGSAQVTSSSTPAMVSQAMRTRETANLVVGQDVANTVATSLKDTWGAEGATMFGFKYTATRKSKVFQLGPLFFMPLTFFEDYQRKEKIDELTKEDGNIIDSQSAFIKKSLGDLYKQYPRNMIFIPPYMPETPDTALNQFTSGPIAGMLVHFRDIKGKTFVDLGAGAGILSLVALALGASKVILVEKPSFYPEFARKLLKLHGYTEGQDFEIIPKDLVNQQEEIIQEIKAKEPAPQQIVIGLNMGPWPFYEQALTSAHEISQALNPILMFESGFVSVDRKYNVPHQKILMDQRKRLKKAAYTPTIYNLPDNHAEGEFVSLLVTRRNAAMTAEKALDEINNTYGSPKAMIDDFNSNRFHWRKIGEGGDAKVYQVPLLPRYVLRIHEEVGHVPVFKPEEVVRDSIPDDIKDDVGHALVSMGDYTIQEYKSGHTVGKIIDLDSAKEDWVSFRKKISQMPQESFNRLVRVARVFTENGYSIDLTNTANLLVDSQISRFHLVDVAKSNKVAGLNIGVFIRCLLDIEMFRMMGAHWEGGLTFEEKGYERIILEKSLRALLENGYDISRIMFNERDLQDIFGFNIEQFKDMFEAVNPAMLGDRKTGGIDLTGDKMPLEVKKEIASSPKASRNDMTFNINPAMLTQLQDAQGFVPVIITIEPLDNIRRFLGITENSTKL